MVAAKHILFIVENATVPMDLRVWREATTLKKNGYDVSVISPKRHDNNKSFEIIDNIEIYRHPMPLEAEAKFGFIFEYLYAIICEFFLSIKVYLKKPFHYIHAANPPDNIFIIGLFFKLFGVKYIFDHHDICPENYVAKFHRKDLFYSILLLFEKLTFKNSDIVISTNDSYKKIAINRGNKKKENVFVVRNGPDLSMVKFVPPNKALKNGFEFLIVYVGVIGVQDGIENLLHIAKHIKYEKKKDNIKFLIVGSGPHRQYLVELSKQMDLDGTVEFTGFVPYRRFYEAIATADLCINPEYKNEFTDKSTMLKIMDYMTFKKPIIQVETTEGKITAGPASFYVKKNDIVEFSDAIINLLNDSKKRRTMGDAGWLRLNEKLIWKKQKTNLLAAYNFLDNLSR